jgi:branched-chain amino acid transport system permease protein
MILVELLLQGIVQGSIYALIALGLTLVYGLLRILHVAHAAMFTLGGYIGVIVTNQTGSLALGLGLAAVIVGLVGMAIYRLAYEPLLDKPPYIALIASIALFIASEEIFRIVFGAYGLSYVAPPLQGTVTVPGTTMVLKQAEILVIVMAVLLLMILASFSQRTRTGVAWRATVTDPAIAESFGANLKNIRYLNFFIGSALAAIAGVLVALLNNLVEPTMGSVPSYKALAIIVLGGLGSIRGALIASLALGVIEAYGTVYAGNILDRDAIAFAFLILVLMIRPQGLLTKS